MGGHTLKRTLKQRAIDDNIVGETPGHNDKTECTSLIVHTVGTGIPL